MPKERLYYSLLVLVQSIAESFPVSSSSHTKIFMKLWEYLFGYLPKNSIFWEDAVHGVTALALLPLFFKLIITTSEWKNAFIWIIVVDSLTAIGYIVVRPQVQHWCPAFFLLLTSSFLFLLNFLPNDSNLFDYQNLNSFLWRAVAVGFLQAFAFIPGISRLGLIFVFLRLTGWSTYQSWYWSWLGMMPLLVMRSCWGTYNLIIRGTSLYDILTLFFMGTFFSWVSLQIMFKYIVNSFFLFVYPLILGILWYIFGCV